MNPLYFLIATVMISPACFFYPQVGIVCIGLVGAFMLSSIKEIEKELGIRDKDKNHDNHD